MKTASGERGEQTVHVRQRRKRGNGADRMRAIRVGDELWDAIGVRARQLGVSVSEHVRSLLERDLARAQRGARR